ncbi:sugar phosphate isomerase/epimerase [Georgenia sp. EYE_87]|uniref:sugar phosphate isomerase/epimerase family protein n=1 Tax=Georgenia sp. EYE_87 TaxID=2853448 RepID=UPI002003429E|nr:TIM barrel protein [Georgenia sp. EYE_87]MCK6210094.1 sugar phosphate isomerase/epimerase [Georgenia sp. EYE_87]
MQNSVAFDVTLSAMNLPQLNFQERCRAAATAGFTGIGLSLRQWLTERDRGADVQTIKAILADNGLVLTEIEGPWDWAHQGDLNEEDALMVELVNAFGPLQVTAVQLAPTTGSGIRAGLRRWATLVQERDSVIALEFMPFGQVADLRSALTILESVESGSVGLLLDTWHVERTAAWSELHNIPIGSICSVQLCDAEGQAAADVRWEARHRRQLPGEQSRQLVERLDRLGHTPRYAVEVWSDGLNELDQSEVAQQLYAAATDVLGRGLAS